MKCKPADLEISFIMLPSRVFPNTIFLSYQRSEAWTFVLGLGHIVSLLLTLILFKYNFISPTGQLLEPLTLYNLAIFKTHSSKSRLYIFLW